MFISVSAHVCYVHNTLLYSLKTQYNKQHFDIQYGLYNKYFYKKCSSAYSAQ